MRGAVVLRPEPGNAATAARLEALGIDTLRAPLFAVAAVAWHPPDPAAFGALLLTSANAARQAGNHLRRYTHLPLLAVGDATATAAREAGLEPALVGDADAGALVRAARARGFNQLLHLAGHDRIAVDGVESVTVYRSEALPIAPAATTAWADRVALLHSARAGRRFAKLVDRDDVSRSRIAVVALSAAVCDAAGQGWAAAAVAEHPTDAALTALAAAMVDRGGGGGDNPGR